MLCTTRIKFSHVGVSVGSALNNIVENPDSSHLILSESTTCSLWSQERLRQIQRDTSPGGEGGAGSPHTFLSFYWRRKPFPKAHAPLPLFLRLIDQNLVIWVFS